VDAKQKTKGVLYLLPNSSAKINKERKYCKMLTTRGNKVEFTKCFQLLCRFKYFHKEKENEQGKEGDVTERSRN
jgi:hypothetical protein